MKRFLKVEVEKEQAYPGVGVKWERGHPVTLVLYDELDKEVERHNMEGWEVDKVRDMLHARGFHKKASDKLAGVKIGFNWLGSKSGEADRSNHRTQPLATAGLATALRMG